MKFYSIAHMKKKNVCFSEKITAVICLPIATINTKLSTHCIPDWFCIVIGFSNGFVKFYTEVNS